MIKQFDKSQGGLGQIMGLAQTGIGIATGNPMLIASGIGSLGQGTELQELSPLMSIMGMFGSGQQPSQGSGWYNQPKPMSSGFMSGY